MEEKKVSFKMEHSWNTILIIANIYFQSSKSTKLLNTSIKSGQHLKENTKEKQNRA